MVVKRKKKIIDGMDRSILRSIHTSRRNLSSRQIAQKVKLSPSAIAPRLNNLKSQGIIKQTKVSGMRSFDRTFKIKGVAKPVVKKIKAPRSILWGINFNKAKSKSKVGRTKK